MGSLHGDRNYAVADLVRSQVPLDSDATNSNIELFIPNQTGKVVVVSLVMCGTEYCRGKVFTEDFRIWVPSSIPRCTHASTYIGSRKDKPTTPKTTLHSQLLSAQSSLFDAELFQDVRELQNNLLFSFVLKFRYIQTSCLSTLLSK